MKILHVLSSSVYSGAENVVCQIISLTTRDGENTAVYCSPDGPIAEALSARRIAFAPMKKMSLREIKRVIREQKPDVIHAHDMRASLFAALVCGKTPMVSHIHNNAFDSRKTSLKAVLYRYAAHKSSHIFWVSQSAFDGYAFHRKYDGKSSILYNVIDPNELRSRMEQDALNYDYDVIFCGRLSVPKDPMRLMEVCRLLADKEPDIKIAVVGSGEMDDEVRARANELFLQSNVSFLGFRKNPLKLINDSKVMIMTSLWEGTPMCALEAMALGTPIVSTPVDGLKLLVENGANGYLSDDNDELAQKIVSIVTDDALRAALSKGQLEKSEKWNDMDKYRREIISSYHKACNMH